MPKFRKKPVVIEAVQWTGSNLDDVIAFTEPHPIFVGAWIDTDNGCGLIIPTLEGDHLAKPRDWIIKGVAGEVYPCKPDIFAATYDIVQE